MMRLEFTRRLLSKAGNCRRECEDSISTCTAAGRYAVADGATEGFDSGRWARLLTRSWVSERTSARGGTWVLQCVPELGERLNKRWQRATLPWYAAEKALGGAFAAFVGLDITPEGRWSAVASGDCCLLIEDAQGELRLAFPLQEPAQFGTRPLLVGSRSTAGELEEAIQLHEGAWQSGETFLLVSDALAAWYLTQATDAVERLTVLHAALDSAPDAFDRFAATERSDGALRNDDVAVLRIRASR